MRSNLLLGTLVAMFAIHLPAAIKAGGPKPVITENPIGRTVTEGGPFTLAVAADTTNGLSYQWWKGGQMLTNNSRLTGVSNTVLSFDPIVLAEAGDYTAVVTSSGGSVTSAVASVTVTQMLFGVTPLGTTGAVVTLSGQVGDVYRVEVSVNFGPWLTNGYATNFNGTATFIDHSTGDGFRNLRGRYERLLPVMYSPQRTNSQWLVRVYGKLNDAWRLEGTSDFQTWIPLSIVTNVTGWAKITDTSGPPTRFYRISAP